MGETTITLSFAMRRKLNKYKYALDCKTVEELFERILKIVDASEVVK